MFTFVIVILINAQRERESQIVSVPRSTTTKAECAIRVTSRAREAVNKKGARLQRMLQVGIVYTGQVEKLVSFDCLSHILSTGLASYGNVSMSFIQLGTSIFACIEHAQSALHSIWTPLLLLGHFLLNDVFGYQIS